MLFKNKKILGFKNQKNLFFNSITKRGKQTFALEQRKKTGLLSGEDVITSEGLTKKKIEEILDVSVMMQEVVENKGYTDLLHGKVLGNVFYEASTRTSSSYQAAMLRLGGKVLPLNAATSSVQKGETLSDTIRVFQHYIDVMVLRHPEQGAAKVAADNTLKPVINAGDGPGEHPTQTLLDLLCIRSELGKLDGITLTLVGDLKYGRTVRSLCKVVKFWGMKVNLISPPQLKMSDSIIDTYLKGCEVNISTDLKSVIPKTDVLYVTRVQKERFEDIEEYERLKDAYIINNDMLKDSKKGMIIMHPLPRVNEIHPEVDNHPSARYFKQVSYGMYLRMTLLAGVLGFL
eukprot:TRINITY_DN519_c0_g1_i1.p1 TRINITY_DN519_c0_g1~~TRINITY_DN519_c0_g1_i1.p1  ORF type:complete len:345 (-),score=106.25 TRINITY_DN519_c0_g1_i1:42-1076(-)